MFYIEIIDDEIARYTENENVANKFYDNFIESETEPKRGFDGKLYLKEIPSDVLVLEEKYKIQEKIAALEAQQTPRRIREATLGINSSKEFLQEIDKQIEILRGILQCK